MSQTPLSIFSHLKSLILLTLVSATLSLSISLRALAGSEFAAQGVYVNVGNGYVSAKAIPGINGFNYDFGKYLMTLPELKGDQLTIDLVVHKTDFTPEWASIELRDIENPGAGIALQAKHSEELAKNIQKFTFELPARDRHFLLVDTGCCNNNIYGVSLTDTKAATIKIFSDESLNPTSAEYSLGGILRGAPDDKELNALMASIKDRQMQKNASYHFEGLQKAWSNYESAEEREQRFDRLTIVKKMSEGYIAKYPQGKDLAKVKKYLDIANEKLAI